MTTQMRRPRFAPAVERLEARTLLAADPFSIAVLPDTQHYARQYPETVGERPKLVITWKPAASSQRGVR